MNYSFVFLFLVLELAGSMPVQKHVIEQRRAKPRLDKPMDLEELDRQCEVHGWGACKQATVDLMALNSSINQHYRQCLNNAMGTDKKIQLTAQIPLNIGSGIKDGDFDVEEVPEVIECTRQDFVSSRQFFCDYVQTISTHADRALNNQNSAVLVLPSGEKQTKSILNLKDLAKCVSWKQGSEDQEFTPSEIIQKIDIWLTKTVQDRRIAPNCGNCRSLLEGIPDDSNPKIPHTKECPEGSQNLWEQALGNFSKLMKADELLKNLGRKGRKCLRGCVKPAQVQCVEHVGLITPIRID